LFPVKLTVSAPPVAELEVEIVPTLKPLLAVPVIVEPAVSNWAQLELAKLESATPGNEELGFQFPGVSQSVVEAPPVQLDWAATRPPVIRRRLTAVAATNEKVRIMVQTVQETGNFLYLLTPSHAPKNK
jgi:hypothetical protein